MSAGNYQVADAVVLRLSPFSSFLYISHLVLLVHLVQVVHLVKAQQSADAGAPSSSICCFAPHSNHLPSLLVYCHILIYGCESTNTFVLSVC